MPNWCKNRVDFYSENKEDLKKVLDIFSSKESIFGQIIPEPNWKTTPNKDGELPVDGEYPYPPPFPESGRTDDRWYDYRDKFMIELHQKYPKYKLERFSNKRWGANKVYRNVYYLQYFVKGGCDS